MDIRKPIGLLFTILGALLIGCGLFGGENATRAKTIEDTININLWWGLVLLIFGVIMLGLALLAKKSEN